MQNFSPLALELREEIEDKHTVKMQNFKHPLSE